LSDDLLRSSSKTQHLGSVRRSAFIGFTAGSRQIAGQTTLLQLWVKSGRLIHPSRKRRALAPARVALVRVSSGNTNRDLGAGQTQAARSGPSGMDAARAPSGHGCPFGAGPRSVVGVREPDEGGPNQEFRPLVTWGYQVTRRRRNSLAVRANHAISASTSARCAKVLNATANAPPR
jgi:hypothetical protein